MKLKCQAINDNGQICNKPATFVLVEHTEQLRDKKYCKEHCICEKHLNTEMVIPDMIFTDNETN
jgi:hypothetical protein